MIVRVMIAAAAAAAAALALLAARVSVHAEDDPWRDAKAARAVWSDCITSEAKKGVHDTAPAEDLAEAALLKCGARSDDLLNTLMAPPTSMSTADAIELVKSTKEQGRSEIINFIKKSRGE